MIWESVYWKDDLMRKAKSLQWRCTQQKRWPEASFAKTEQEIMIGCYTIRKLIEAQKLTTALVDSLVSLSLHRCKNDVGPSHSSWYQLDRHYDLLNSKNTCLPLRQFCNQMIHSFVFILGFSEQGKLKEVVFNSDKTRAKFVYGIEVVQLAELFMNVATNYPASYIEGMDDEGKRCCILA